MEVRNAIKDAFRVTPRTFVNKVLVASAWVDYDLSLSTQPMIWVFTVWATFSFPDRIGSFLDDLP
jgi:hypothetical protein